MLETLRYEPSSGSPPRLEHSSQYLKLSESYNGFYFILCDFSSSLKLFDPPQPHSLPVSGAGASIPNTPVKPLLLHKNIDHSSLLIMISDGTSRRNKQLRGWKIISFWKRRGVQLRGFTVKDYKEGSVGSPQKFSLEQKEVDCCHSLPFHLIHPGLLSTCAGHLCNQGTVLVDEDGNLPRFVRPTVSTSCRMQTALETNCM